MQSFIGYRPSPEAREIIHRAVESKRYASPGHVINDAINRVHNPAPLTERRLRGRTDKNAARRAEGVKA